jgi:hypothetical protein
LECAMAALFKYFMGVAVILPAVIVLGAMNMNEIFVRVATVARAPAAETPRWNIKRLKAEPDTPYLAKGSLSPIYPTFPGKELLGKPVYAASAKRISIREALQLHQFPRQLYTGDEQDSNYLHQSLSYTETPLSQPSQPRTPVIFGHGIY